LGGGCLGSFFSFSVFFFFFAFPLFFFVIFFFFEKIIRFLFVFCPKFKKERCLGKGVFSGILSWFWGFFLGGGGGGGVSKWNEELLHIHILENKMSSFFSLKNSGSLFVHRGVTFYQSMCSLNSGSKLTCSHPIIGEPEHSKGDSVQKVDSSGRCCWRH